MKNLFAFLFIYLLIAGCGQTGQKTKTDIAAGKDTITATEPVTSMAGCHQMIIGPDTAYMTLQESGDSLYGPLEYKRFEKDSNEGFVHLVKKNDRAEGWYTFQSEGKKSVRQIIFKLNENSLAEAYGDIGMRGDSAFYKYPNALQFEETHMFIKVNCK